MFDVLIIGGGPAAVSCALILGSAHNKPFMTDKKIGIFTHQKASYLQEALLNNVYGIAAGSLGKEVMESSYQQLEKLYPHISQMPNEKIVSVLPTENGFVVKSNLAAYETKNVVIATNSSNAFQIDGLMQYVEPHQKSLATKNRIQLRNNDHKITTGLYVAGTLAGHRSQVAIASGSGATVATDLLTLWNNGIETHAHDSTKNK